MKGIFEMLLSDCDHKEKQIDEQQSIMKTCVYIYFFTWYKLVPGYY